MYIPVFLLNLLRIVDSLTRPEGHCFVQITIERQVGGPVFLSLLPLVISSHRWPIAAGRQLLQSGQAVLTDVQVTGLNLHWLVATRPQNCVHIREMCAYHWCR